jgi:hypothetical protein
MHRSIAFVAALVVVAPACGTEQEHEHSAADFATKAECEEHYAEEGHSDDEIADLCADVPE